jgi:hypothetical protein
MSAEKSSLTRQVTLVDDTQDGGRERGSPRAQLNTECQWRKGAAKGKSNVKSDVQLLV